NSERRPAVTDVRRVHVELAGCPDRRQRDETEVNSGVSREAATTANSWFVRRLDVVEQYAWNCFGDGVHGADRMEICGRRAIRGLSERLPRTASPVRAIRPVFAWTHSGPRCRGPRGLPG